jgi:ferritin-like metal-binding protein YciE
MRICGNALQPESRRQYALQDKIQILRGCFMQQKALKELYVDELRDIYNAETQLVKALPKMARAASNEELRSGFEEHLEQTKGHVSRLEQIFEDLDEKPTGKKCAGMEGLVKEGSEMVGEDFEGPVKDAGLIGAAQRVEHYEIAAYGTVRAFAETLGEQKAVELLSQTLEEEKETDEKLTKLASEINVEANQGTKSEDEEETPAANRKRKSAHA